MSPRRMEPVDFASAMDKLIDGWCERRKLAPLRLILRAYPLAMGLTDDWTELQSALRQIRGSCREDLSAEELETVISLTHEVERALER